MENDGHTFIALSRFWSNPTAIPLMYRFSRRIVLALFAAISSECPAWYVGRRPRHGRKTCSDAPSWRAQGVPGAAFPRVAQANVPTPYSADLQPPTTSREAFIKWAVENRGENPRILAARWDRYVFLRANNDFINARNGRAFLLTPRDEFVLKRDIGRAYERDFHDIGWGVTISGPLVVSRMTSTIDVQMGEKVLEIGTGSGNQSAYLSNLTDKVWTIEII